MNPGVGPGAGRRADAEIVVDLAAVRHNVHRLLELVFPAELMVVVKADGYGHGMIEVARAVREAGAGWVAVATPDEAVALRRAGDEGPLLCWLAAPGYDYREAVRRGITLTAYDVEQLDAIAGQVAGQGADHGPADVQLKLDTGLSRGGAPRLEWERLLARTAQLQDEGTVLLDGIWSHFACSDDPGHPANDAQEQAFRQGVELARDLGLDPGRLHLANSAAALLRPSSRLDLVRVGLAAYGLNPAPDALDTAGLGLRPAMTVRTTLVSVKDVRAGDGVSYGHTFVADRPMRVGLVPAGYGDGVPRHASGTAQVQVRGHRCPILGRVCMDQFVIDVGSTGAEPGDDVVLFGAGDAGEPLAQDWAEACGTISYEIVSRVGGRMSRTYVEEAPR